MKFSKEAKRPLARQAMECLLNRKRIKIDGNEKYYNQLLYQACSDYNKKLENYGIKLEAKESKVFDEFVGDIADLTYEKGFEDGLLMLSNMMQKNCYVYSRNDNNECQSPYQEMYEHLFSSITKIMTFTNEGKSIITMLKHAQLDTEEMFIDFNEKGVISKKNK